MTDTNSDKQTAALERIAESLESIAKTLKSLEQEGVKTKPNYLGI